jgi:hypothetical protein
MPPPPNDNLADAQDLGVLSFVPTTVSGTTVDATSEGEEVTFGYGPSVWYTVDIPTTDLGEDNTVVIDIAKTGGDAGWEPYVEIYLVVTEPPTVFGDMNFSGSIGDGTANPPGDQVAVAPGRYVIGVSNWDGSGTPNEGTFDLSVSFVRYSFHNGALSGNALDVDWFNTDPWGGCLEGSLVGFTSEGSEPAHSGFGPSQSAWFRFLPPVNGHWQFWTDGPGDMVMSLYSSASLNPASFAALTSIDEDDSSGPGGNPLVEADLVTGTRYFIAVDCQDADGTNFTIYWNRTYSPNTPPANDEFVDVEDLGTGTTFGATTGSTRYASGECDEPPEPNNLEGPANSVWYKWVAPATLDALLEVRPDSGTEDIVHFAIYRQDGATIRDLVLVDSGSTGTFGVFTQLFFSADSGATYYFVLQNFALSDDYTAFTLQGSTSSLTPPANDDFADAEAITGEGTFSGDIEGSTLEAGEPDAVFGTPSGTVWYKFTPDCDTVIRMRAWRTPRTTSQLTYAVEVWEGSAVNALDYVPYMQRNDVYQKWLLKAGVEYHIQVIRLVGQPWQTFDLVVDLFPECIDWDGDIDGWGTLSGTAAMVGDKMRVTGGAGMAQVDLLAGGNTHIGCRALWVRFTLDITDGRGLYRNNDQAFSIMRLVSEDSSRTLELRLKATREGNQILELRRASNAVLFTFGGTGSTTAEWGRSWEATDRGEGDGSDIEVVLIGTDIGHITSTATTSYGNLNALAIDTWGYILVYIGGELVGGSTIQISPNQLQDDSDIQYVEIGPDPWPSDPSGHTPIGDWQLDFGDLAIRDMVALGPPCPHGFATDDEQWLYWDSWLHDAVFHPAGGAGMGNSGTKVMRSGGGTTIDSSDVVQNIEGRSYDSLAVGDTTPGVSMNWRVRRRAGDPQQPRYGFWLYVTDLPDGTVAPGLTTPFVLLSALNDQFGGLTGDRNAFNQLGAITLDGDGFLYVTPYLQSIASHPLAVASGVYDRTYCLGQIQLNELYWIEVETDKSVPYDVLSTVHINGNLIGTYTNRWLHTEQANHWTWVAAYGDYRRAIYADMPSYGLIAGSPGSISGFTGTFKAYMTMFSLLRRATLPLGPCYIDTQAGVDGEGTHGLPAWPDDADRFELMNYHIIYGWEENIGVFPDSGSDVADGTGPPGYEGENAREYSFGGSGNFKWNDASGQFFVEYTADLRHDYITAFAWARRMAGAGSVRLMESLDDWTDFVCWTVNAINFGTSYEPIFNASYNKIIDDPTGDFDVFADNEANVTTATYTFRLKVMRLLRNSLVYPQYRWTDDNGATHTIIIPGETVSADHIGSDPTASSDDGVFMDNHGAYDWMMVAENGAVYDGDTRGGFTNGEIMKAPQIDAQTHYVEYTVPTPGQAIKAVALWTRQRSYSNWPSTSGSSSGGSMHVRMVGGGKHRMLGDFTTVDANAAMLRKVVSASPEGLPWTADVLGGTDLRMGFWRRMRDQSASGDPANPSPYSYTNYRFMGMLLHALEWEMVVAADAGPVIAPCLAGVVSMNWRSSDRVGQGRRILVGR